MGVGHVPQDPFRPQGSGADVQGRQRRGAAGNRDVTRAAGPGLSNQALGRWGEDQAARWYGAHGFAIVDRNWRSASGEIDLVVRRDALVVFVEVKARTSNAFGDPSGAVTVAKQRRIRRLAAEWLATNAVHGVAVRFDVVSVLGVDVRVIEAAF